MKRFMPFSWRAALLAPLLVPFLIAAFMALAMGRNELLGFLAIFVVAGMLSYGATVLLLIPCLFVASRFTRPTVWLAALLGMALGLLMYFPISWPMYLATGVDSGPPPDSYVHYLCHDILTGSWPFLAAGTMTAVLYWFLAKPSDPGSP
jgi:hypothetical protein